MKFARPTKLLSYMDKQIITENLPAFPTDFYEFVTKVRPFVGEIRRNFHMIPFWVYIYTHMEKNMIIICGRQIYKSTFLSDVLLWIATSGKRHHTMYVTDTFNHFEVFSDQRMREESIIANPLLRKYLPYEHRASKKEIKLLNRSFMRFTHAKRRYGNVESTTNYALVGDEVHAHEDLSKISIARRTLRTTKGYTTLTGIGAAEGSDFHYMITEESDIYEWRYKDDSTLVEEITVTLSNGKEKKYHTLWEHQGWRRHLKYNDDGLKPLTPEEAQLYLRGKFVCINPLPNGEKREWTTYHMPQSIFAEIPLTIHQAKTLYKSNIHDSIEYQKIHDPPMEYIPHCEGWFYRDDAIPLTPADIQKCQDDTIEFLTPDEILQLKQKEKVQVIMGIDWGSNSDEKSGFTVGTIIIHYTPSNRQSSRYQIAYIDKRPVGDNVDIAQHFSEMIIKYHIDHCVADMGYAGDNIKIMQDGGFSQEGGKPITALGRSRIMGVWTSGDLTEETKHNFREATREGIDLEKYSIEKTEYIDKLISLIKSTVPNPKDPNDKESVVPKFIIPFGLHTRGNIEYLERDLTAIKRADKKSSSATSPDDTRQQAKRLYDHPADVVASLMYAIVASEKYDPNSYDITPIKRRRR